MTRPASSSSLALLSFTLVLMLAGCGGGDADPPDAWSATTDARVPEGTDAWRVDDASFADASSPTIDASSACTPTGGPAMGDGYCDLLELAVLAHGDTAEAQIFGRLMPDDAVGCTVIDEIEVLDSGTSIGTIAGAGTFTSGTPDALLARGPALAPMLDRCDTDESRFESYGLLVRGRYDGGSFEVRCGAAEGGSRWPPALRVTCHENLDHPPTWANAMLSSFMGHESAQVSFMVPHDAGAAITAVSGPVRVISYASAFPPGPPAPARFDVADFVANVSEGTTPTLGTFTTVSLLASRDPFGTMLCPASPTMPMPGDPPPPALMLRLAGTSERGPFATDVYVEGCTRPSF